MSIFDVGKLFPLNHETLKVLSTYGLLGAMGITLTHFEGGKLYGQVELSDQHQAPNGYLHAGVVVSLADTLCGIGCQLLLPEGATGFTTMELKTNFLSTAQSGTIRGVARRIHGGRTTQVWDCQVSSDLTGKSMAEFRCTQLLVYPAES